jgi:hypothetical protein
MNPAATPFSSRASKTPSLRRMTSHSNLRNTNQMTMGEVTPTRVLNPAAVPFTPFRSGKSVLRADATIFKPRASRSSLLNACALPFEPSAVDANAATSVSAVITPLDINSSEMQPQTETIDDSGVPRTEIPSKRLLFGRVDSDEHVEGVEMPERAANVSEEDSSVKATESSEALSEDESQQGDSGYATEEDAQDAEDAEARQYPQWERIHHYNWLCNPICLKSTTRPATSLAIIMSKPKTDFLIDTDATVRTLTQQTLIRRAWVWVDPVIFRGDRSVLKLRGTNLENTAIGLTAKFYGDVGRWRYEPRDIDDDVPDTDGFDETTYEYQDVVVNGCYRDTDVPTLNVYANQARYNLKEAESEKQMATSARRVQKPKPKSRLSQVCNMSELDKIDAPLLDWADEADEMDDIDSQDVDEALAVMRKNMNLQATKQKAQKDEETWLQNAAATELPDDVEDSLLEIAAATQLPSEIEENNSSNIRSSDTAETEVATVLKEAVDQQLDHFGVVINVEEVIEDDIDAESPGSSLPVNSLHDPCSEPEREVNTTFFTEALVPEEATKTSSTLDHSSQLSPPNTTATTTMPLIVVNSGLSEASSSPAATSSASAETTPPRAAAADSVGNSSTTKLPMAVPLTPTLSRRSEESLYSLRAMLKTTPPGMRSLRPVRPAQSARNIDPSPRSSYELRQQTKSTCGLASEHAKGVMVAVKEMMGDQTKEVHEVLRGLGRQDKKKNRREMIRRAWKWAKKLVGEEQNVLN